MQNGATHNLSFSSSNVDVPFIAFSHKLQNFINGEFLSSDCNSDEYFNDVTGFNNTVIAVVPDATQNDVNKAVNAANDAHKKWNSIGMRKRSEYLFKLADLVAKYKTDLAQIESLDTGKPYELAINVDLNRVIENFRYFASLGLTNGDDAFHGEGEVESMSITMKSPLGVVAIITPWNLPLHLLTFKLAPALLMGNCVVCKPCELTPLSTTVLCKLFQEAKVPEGVFNVIHGKGKQAGSMLIKHNLVKAVAFTGGTVTGREISSVCGQLGKKLSLELGGKNAGIIFSDCDLDKCLDTVLVSSFQNAGQVCMSTSILLIEENIYAEFIQRLKDKIIKTIKPGCGWFGSLISKQHLDKVHSYVERAKLAGGNIIIGGEPYTKDLLSDEIKNGFYYKPTLIDGLSNDSEAFQEEIFGPVIVLKSFKDANEAWNLANSTKYGLCASIWTKNLKISMDGGKQLQCGTVWVNSWSLRDSRCPFGGVKNSGMGMEGSTHSMEFFSNTKTFVIKMN